MVSDTVSDKTDITSLDLQPKTDWNAPITSLPPFPESMLEIPRTIHQTWRDVDSVPRMLDIWSQTCKTMHPPQKGWSFKLWTDADIQQFVEVEFGWFKDTFHHLPFGISKIDAFRYMIMYKVHSTSKKQSIIPTHHIIAWWIFY